jgi:hypothetical protein
MPVHHVGALVTTSFGVFVPRGGFAPPRKRSIGAVIGMCVYWAGDMFVLWACLAAFMQHGRPPTGSSTSGSPSSPERRDCWG